MIHTVVTTLFWFSISRIEGQDVALLFWNMKKKKKSPGIFSVLGLGWAVVLVLAISDRSVICLPFFLFVVDRAVCVLQVVPFSTTHHLSARKQHTLEEFLHHKGNARASSQCACVRLQKIRLRGWKHCSRTVVVNHVLLGRGKGWEAQRRSISSSVG